MLINGIEYNKTEMEHQIIFLKKAIEHYKTELEKWTKYLFEEASQDETNNKGKN